MRKATLFVSAVPIVIAFLVCCMSMVVAHAQSPTFSDSYVTPFPEGDVYKASVVGDSLSEGLQGVFLDTLERDPRVNLARSRWRMNSLLQDSFGRKVRDLKRDLSSSKAHIAIVMVGAWDRRSYYDSTGQRHRPGSEGWRKEFSRRVDRLIKVLKGIKVAVYWVGLPTMRKANSNEQARAMNEVIRERAYLNGVKYIDAYTSFADEFGAYTAYGPDLTGKIRLLRERDGVHLSYAGSQKLAHFVDREIRRDLQRAKSERVIPLAGDEKEQVRIRQGVKAANRQVTKAGWQASLDAAKKKVKSDKPQRRAAFMNSSSGEQKEANSLINLKVRKADGQEELVPLEILRPAIPASVVAVVTRKQSPDRLANMGATLVDQIEGGVNIMSSVTPAVEAAAGSAARKISPAQTPFFRVLVKGERTSAKPGRADDFSWPRPPPPPLPPIVTAKPKRSPARGGIPLPTANPLRPRV